MGGTRLSFPQGFHRYSTDFSWHVPHFEKMLYDQAQLAVAYITASQVCVFVSTSDTVTASPSLCLSVILVIYHQITQSAKKQKTTNIAM